MPSVATLLAFAAVALLVIAGIRSNTLISKVLFVLGAAFEAWFFFAPTRPLPPLFIGAFFCLVAGIIEYVNRTAKT